LLVGRRRHDPRPTTSWSCVKGGRGRRFFTPRPLATSEIVRVFPARQTSPPESRVRPSDEDSPSVVKGPLPGRRGWGGGIDPATTHAPRSLPAILALSRLRPATESREALRIRDAAGEGEVVIVSLGPGQGGPTQWGGRRWRWAPNRAVHRQAGRTSSAAADLPCDIGGTAPRGAPSSRGEEADPRAVRPPQQSADGDGGLALWGGGCRAACRRPVIFPGGGAFPSEAGTATGRRGRPSSASDRIPRGLSRPVVGPCPTRSTSRAIRSPQGDQWGGEEQASRRRSTAAECGRKSRSPQTAVSSRLGPYRAAASPRAVGGGSPGRIDDAAFRRPRADPSSFSLRKRASCGKTLVFPRGTTAARSRKAVARVPVRRGRRQTRRRGLPGCGRRVPGVWSLRRNEARAAFGGIRRLSFADEPHFEGASAAGPRCRRASQAGRPGGRKHYDTVAVSGQVGARDGRGGRARQLVSGAGF